MMPPLSETTWVGCRFRIPRNGMNVNPAHQTAADNMLIRTAMPSVSPNGSVVTSTKLAARSRPPPAYP